MSLDSTTSASVQVDFTLRSDVVLATCELFDASPPVDCESLAMATVCLPRCTCIEPSDVPLAINCVSRYIEPLNTASTYPS